MFDWTALRKSMLGERPKSLLPPRVRLPVLPHAVMQFSRQSEEPDANPAELGQLIETDSGLTCELMRYVNSSAVGLRRRVASAQQAIALLGIRESRLYLLSSGLKRAMRSSESKLINCENFWATNLERALFSREVAMLLKADQELAFTGGMLQDFLLPALTNQLFPRYYDFATKPPDQPMRLTAYEKKVHGWDHTQAGAQVLFGWGFPDDLICCVLIHHQGLKLLGDPKLGKTAAAAVAVSGLMPDALEQVPDGLERLLKLEAAWPAFDLLRIAEAVQEQFETMSPGFAHHFSFLRRCRSLTVNAHA